MKIQHNFPSQAFTIWTGNGPQGPSFSEKSTDSAFTLWSQPDRTNRAPQTGVINGLPVSEWRGDRLAFERPDCVAILF